MIRDLLNPSSGFLDLREDHKGVQVTGLSEHSAASTDQVSHARLAELVIIYARMQICAGEKFTRADHTDNVLYATTEFIYITEKKLLYAIHM